MADRKISDLTALTTPAAGDYLPIVDISEASASNKNKRITIEELLRGAPDGTAGAPSIAFESDGGNGLYLAGTDTIGVSTNGVNRLTLDTAAFSSTLPVVHPLGADATPSITFTGDLNTGIWSPAADTLAASTDGTERLRIDSSGRLLVGTSSTTGSTSNTRPVIAGLFQSFDNVATFTTGVAQTLFAIPNTNATYIVTLRRGSVGDATNYEAVSILSTNAGGSVSAVLTDLKTAANVSISISGTNLQGTQTSGGNASLRWIVTRVG